MSGNGKWQHSLQAISVFITLYSFYLAPLLSFILITYLLYFTNLWPVVFIYLIWMYIDRDTPSTTGRRSKLIRNCFLWKYARDYFPQRLVKTADLDASQNHLFCFFPHGILLTAAWCHFANDTSRVHEYYPGTNVYGLTLNINFYVPFFREFTLGWGLMSVSKESIERLLTGSKGKIICIAPGGSKEASKTELGKYRLVLRKRKGFVKMAIKTGTCLVPVMIFGETELFEHYIPGRGSVLEKVMSALRSQTGVAFCLYRGCGLLGLLPFRKPVTTVVGKPITVIKNENPSQEEVDKLHEEFMTSLISLFEEHKAKYVANPESAHLVIED